MIGTWTSTCGACFLTSSYHSQHTATTWVVLLSGCTTMDAWICTQTQLQPTYISLLANILWKYIPCVIPIWNVKFSYTCRLPLIMPWTDQWKLRYGRKKAHSHMKNSFHVVSLYFISIFMLLFTWKILWEKILQQRVNMISKESARHLRYVF